MGRNATLSFISSSLLNLKVQPRSGSAKDSVANVSDHIIHTTTVSSAAPSSLPKANLLIVMAY